MSIAKRVATVVAGLSLLATSAGAIELRLLSVKGSFRVGESPTVRVLVSNPLDSKAVPHLKRGFWLVPFSLPMDGDLGLIIHVTGPDGLVLKPTTRHMIVVRMRTDPAMFQALHPGAIFGEEIALDGEGLEYDMKAPGIYRVRGTLSAAAPRKWFDEWRRTNRGAPDPQFKRDDLFEGPIFSPPLEVVVAE